MSLESRRGALRDLGTQFPDQKIREIFEEVLEDTKEQGALDLIRSQIAAFNLMATGMTPDGQPMMTADAEGNPVPPRHLSTRPWPRRCRCSPTACTRRRWWTTRTTSHDELPRRPRLHRPDLPVPPQRDYECRRRLQRLQGRTQVGDIGSSNSGALERHGERRTWTSGFMRSIQDTAISPGRCSVSPRWTPTPRAQSLTPFAEPLASTHRSSSATSRSVGWSPGRLMPQPSNDIGFRLRASACIPTTAMASGSTPVTSTVGAGSSARLSEERSKRR